MGFGGFYRFNLVGSTADDVLSNLVVVPAQNDLLETLGVNIWVSVWCFQPWLSAGFFQHPFAEAHLKMETHS